MNSSNHMNHAEFRQYVNSSQNLNQVDLNQVEYRVYTPYYMAFYIMRLDETERVYS